ncbi:MAG: alpha,alpha-trehalose-phosphate synthase (UDP-forming) [Candidatus Binataceae bacterium]
MEATSRSAEMESGGRLIVVSNRAPVKLITRGDATRVETTVGGVATAFVQLLEKFGGLWIAWSGTTEDFSPLKLPQDNPRFSMILKGLTEAETTQYYWGMCNRGLWPLMHQMTANCRFNSRDWVAYRAVNQSFADQCLAQARAGDTIWIQDFHLVLMPKMVRRQAPHLPIGVFWHVPFPPEEVLSRFPWRDELLEGMLGADLIGFQTDEHRSAFLECCQNLPGAEVDHEHGIIVHRGRTVRVGAFPIGAPLESFQRFAADPHTARRVRQIRRGVYVEKLILGVDRLDYTKGLLERLMAFERFLERHPRYEGRVTMLQIAVPSRTRVPEYMMLRRQLEQRVARIVARFFHDGWFPVRYLYKAYPPQTVAAYYRAADVAMVTPLRDGMNLVAKEYVASRVDGDGVLVLSNQAGASDELKEALIVDPTNIEELAAALKRGIEMEPDERRSRMRMLRARIATNTLTDWADGFLTALHQAHQPTHARRTLAG